MEAENFDRLDMRLPGYQEQMLQDVINNGRFVVFLGALPLPCYTLVCPFQCSAMAAFSAPLTHYFVV